MALKGISPIDVAIVDPDLLWRVQRMNLIKGPNVRTYGMIDDALAELTADWVTVLVLGPNEPPERLDVVERLAIEQPEIKVIILPPEDDPAFTARADACGADIVLPFDAEDQEIEDAVFGLLPKPAALLSAADVRTAFGLESPSAVERSDLPKNLIIITSAKGGEGVTTVAANLAVALATLPSVRIALVDGDPDFGDIALLFGQARGAPPVVQTLPMEDALIDKLAKIHEETGILIVRQPQPILDDRQAQPQVLLDVLAAVADRADVVVLDIPIDLMISANLVPAASTVLLISTIRTASLKNSLVAAKRLGSPDNVALVLNETGRPRDEPSVRELERLVGLPVLGELPFDHKLDRASTHAIPRLVGPAHSRFTRAIGDLRDTIVERASILM